MGLEGIVSKRKDSPSPSPARNNVGSASRDTERPCANSPRETSLGRASKMLLAGIGMAIRLRSKKLPGAAQTPLYYPRSRQQPPKSFLRTKRGATNYAGEIHTR